MKDETQTEAKPLTAVEKQRVVMRQLLTEEIKSLDRSIERLEKGDSLDAAAFVSAKRDGVCWALFVLNVRLGA